MQRLSKHLFQRPSQEPQDASGRESLIITSTAPARPLERFDISIRTLDSRAVRGAPMFQNSLKNTAKGGTNLPVCYWLDFLPSIESSPRKAQIGLHGQEV